MLSRLARAAHEYDEWLHQHVGRAYVAVLGWGLVASILGSLSVLGHALSKGRSSLPTLFILVFQTALLINQLAQWHELKQRRRRPKETGLTQAPQPPAPARQFSEIGSGRPELSRGTQAGTGDPVRIP
jgi:hypothetical protein